MGHHTIHWNGHRLDLLPEKALWDPQQGLLLLADVHLGKAECLQAHGVPIPSVGDAANLQDLLDLAHRLQPTAVVVLGDLIHGPLGLTSALRETLLAMPELLGCPLRLIDGNHDRGSWLQGVPREPSGASGPLWLSHAPEPHPALLNVCGHLHPVAVVGRGSDRLRLPCFVHGQQPARLVLPSFGHLTGGHPCDHAERVFVVAGGSVIPLPSFERSRMSRGRLMTGVGHLNRRLSG